LCARAVIAQAASRGQSSKAISIPIDARHLKSYGDAGRELCVRRQQPVAEGGTVGGVSRWRRCGGGAPTNSISAAFHAHPSPPASCPSRTAPPRSLATARSYGELIRYPAEIIPFFDRTLNDEYDAMLRGEWLLLQLGGRRRASGGTCATILLRGGLYRAALKVA
jgi:hypothetical protein